MTKVQAIEDGRAAAERVSTTGWAVFAFFLPIIAVIAAFVRSPRMSALTLAAHDDDVTVRFFEWEYVEALKRRQVKSALIWAAVSVALTFFMFACLVVVGMAS